MKKTTMTLARLTTGRKSQSQSGDYIMANDGTLDGAGEKMLVNIGAQRKSWIKKVAGLLSDGDMTEVLKCVLDHAAVEDPESYALKVGKWRLKTKLEDIEARERALHEEKQRLVSSLQPDRQPADGKNATAA